MNLNRRWILLIIGLVAIVTGLHNIYSSFGGDFSGNHIDKFKLEFSIVLVIIAIVLLYKGWKKPIDSKR